MTTSITLREEKGSPLTHAEVDANFANLKETADNADTNAAQALNAKANATAVGVAADAANMGTYTGTTIPDSGTAKQNIQSLETAVETKANASALGVTASAAHMGTFTGSTIADNQTAKVGMQSLETAVELRTVATTLAASGGSALTGFIDSGAGAVARTVQDELRGLPYSLERFGGGPAASAATNDTAWAAVKALIGDSNTKSIVQFYAGTYSTAVGFDLPAAAYQITLQGLGRGRTKIKTTSATVHTITIPTTGTPHSITIRDLSIEGLSSTANTGNGLHHGGSNDFFGLSLERVSFDNIPNDAIHLPSTAFTFNAYMVDVGSVGGFGFYCGGNTTKLDSCYVHNLITANKAAYRILGATLDATNCNGIDSGDVIWDIGASTVAGDCPGGVADASDAYCFATLTGCNVEDFESIGINVRNGAINILSTAIVAPTSGTVTAINGRFANAQGGFSDRDPAGYCTTKGASWTNSVAVHSRTSAAPFALCLARTNATYTFYDDTAAATKTVSTIIPASIVSTRQGIGIQDLYVTGVLRKTYGGTATLVAGTVAVTFTALPTNTYRVLLSRRGSSGVAYGLYATGHATTGFTITSENAGDVGQVDWSVEY